jgi:hypothetical protein
VGGGFDETDGGEHDANSGAIGWRRVPAETGDEAPDVDKLTDGQAVEGDKGRGAVTLGERVDVEALAGGASPLLDGGVEGRNDGRPARLSHLPEAGSNGRGPGGGVGERLIDGEAHLEGRVGHRHAGPHQQTRSTLLIR